MIKSLKLWILTISIPLQKWVQRRGRRETIITKAQVDRIMSMARPGDILLSYEAQRWTSMFIKGFYDHAVILSSKGTVVEAVGDLWKDGKNIGGVREVDLEEWLYKKDHVALIRVNHASAFAAGMNALKYIGRGYDYSFRHGDEKVYCSELPYLCYRTEWEGFLKELPDDKEILPQYYMDFCGKLKYLELIVDTRAG